MGGILLVEFAVLQRFHRAVSFPFLQGRSRRSGLSVTWIRFGVPAQSQSAAGESGVSLVDEDVVQLKHLAGQMVPDQVLFSHAPSPSLASALILQHPKASFSYVAESDPELEPTLEIAGVQVVPVRSGLDRVLGASLSSDTPWEEAPDYSWIPGNAAATEMDVLPFVFTGEECTYNRSFKSNRFFDPSDLEGCVRPGGCSFCRRPPNEGRRGADPVVLLRAQLLQVRATSPTFGRRQQIRLVGEPIIENIEAVAECILEAGFGPTDFLLDSRSDTLLRILPSFKRALARVRPSGHALHLCLIGIENFCSEELVRYNKGLDASVNLQATRTLFELEAEFPGAFEFRQHGGLSLITFNPWTTPEQLDLNVTVVELLGLSEVAGKLFTGRLRLYKGLPLAAKAKRDGLLVDSYDDPLLDTARHNFYEQEMPWRFAEPLMEPINRILLRLRKNNIAPDFDALTTQVQSLERAADQAGTGATAFAHLVIEMALGLNQQPAVPSPEQVLEAVSQRLNCAPKAPKGEEWTLASGAPETGQDLEQGSLPLEAALQVKPVSKKEPLLAPEMELWLGNPAYPNAKGRKRNWPANSPEEIWELFFGLDAAKVDRAIELTNLLERRDIDDAPRVEANIEVGELLGYPRCCAAGFANEPTSIQTPYFFASVARRVETEGEVSFTLHPVSGLVEYVPCNLKCQASVDRSNWILDAYRWNGPFEKEEFIRCLHNPWFLMQSVQRNFIEVIPEDEPSERTRYRSGRVSGDGPDLEAVIAGDEWVMEDETLLILRKGRPIYSLSGRAYLWWHKRPFQQKFWKQILEFRRKVSPLQAGNAVKAKSPPRLALSTRLANLQRVLVWLKQKPTDYSGFKLVGWEATSSGDLKVRLASLKEGVTLMVQERKEGQKLLFGVGPFALSYPNDAPLETATQWQGARAFVAQLQKTLQELGGKR